MNDEEFRDQARQGAPVVSEQPSCAKYLQYTLSGNSCLIPLNDLAETLPPPYRLARLPGMPVWMAGIMAWRGETIAVVNLDLYFLAPQETDLARETDGTLLVLHSQSQILGLLVPAPATTIAVELDGVVPLTASTHMLLTKHAEMFEGMYADIPILNISVLLTNLVQQIGMATLHG